MLHAPRALETTFSDSRNLPSLNNLTILLILSSFSVQKWIAIVWWGQYWENGIIIRISIRFCLQHSITFFKSFIVNSYMWHSKTSSGRLLPYSKAQTPHRLILAQKIFPSGFRCSIWTYQRLTKTKSNLLPNHPS